MSRAIAVLLLLCTLTFLTGLGRPAIADSDEAYYAESAREMIERGDWLTPYYNYELRFQKPILFYWMIGVLYGLVGVGPAAARFPAALAGVGLCLVCYWCARRWYDERTGLLAGAIAATNFGYFAMARQSLPDLPLAFFISVSVWAGIEGFAPIGCRSTAEPSTDRPPPVRRWILLSAAAAAAAFLTKGPVGIALPALVIAAVLGVHLWPGRRRPWTALRSQLRWTDLVLALAVFLTIAVPWYFAMWSEHGWAYLHRFFIAENLERFASTRYNEPRGWWFYPPIIVAGLLPWSGFLILWAAPMVRVLRGLRPPTAVEARLALWTFAILGFYTWSIGKQPRYVLPILPPLAILLAGAIAARLSGIARRSSRDRGLTTGGLLAGATLLVLGILVDRAQPLFAAISPEGVVAAGTVLAVTGVGVAAASLPRRGTLAPVATVGGGVVCLLALHSLVLSSGGPDPVQRMTASVNAHRLSDEPVGAYRVFVRNLPFYLEQRTEDLYDAQKLEAFLRSPDRVLCVLEERDLIELESAGVLQRPQRLEEIDYFNPATLRIAMLLRPDPGEDLEKVVLIANR